MIYKKHLITLESNPDPLSKSIHGLGVSDQLGFHDVWSLRVPDLLAAIPRPVLALIFIFPTNEDYERSLTAHNEKPSPVPENGFL